MSYVRFRLEGLQELIADLKRLPGELAQGANTEVFDAAHQAASEVIAAYPEVTGNLKGGVKVAKARSGRWGASAQVRSNAPHAHFFEYGTQARQTDLGYNRGPMPGKNVLVPIVQRRRLRMYDALAGMVERAGFTVRE